KTFVDINSQLDSRGLLDWSVPAGHWILFGCWQRPTGQVPQTLTGIASSRTLDQVPPLPEPAMLLVDPFSHTSADAALSYLSDNMLTPSLAALWRQNGLLLFDDSLEHRTRRASDLLWT